jgi:cytochrome subunit of sulfide dehydrogenase
MTATHVLVATAIMLLTLQTSHGAEAPAGASSCTGCHAAQAGTPDMRALAGMPAAAITEKMNAFKAGSAPATIMDRIAKGFSEEEIRALATWYAAQKP